MSRIGRPTIFPDDVSLARIKERNRRSATAQHRAYRMLSKLHPEEYQTLRKQALGKVNEECGPLPGDELL